MRVLKWLKAKIDKKSKIYIVLCTLFNTIGILSIILYQLLLYFDTDNRNEFSKYLTIKDVSVLSHLNYPGMTYGNLFLTTIYNLIEYDKLVAIESNSDSAQISSKEAEELQKYRVNNKELEAQLSLSFYTQYYLECVKVIDSNYASNTPDKIILQVTKLTDDITFKIQSIITLAMIGLIYIGTIIFKLLLKIILYVVKKFKQKNYNIELK